MSIGFKFEETPPGVPTANMTALPKAIGFDPAFLPSTSAGVLNFAPSAPEIEDIQSTKQKFTMDDMKPCILNSDTKFENSESFINEKKELDRMIQNDRIVDLRNNETRQEYLVEEAKPIVENNTPFFWLFILAAVRFVTEMVCLYSLALLSSLFEIVSIGLLFTCTVGLCASALTCLRSCQENSESIQKLEIFSILWSQMYLLFTSLFGIVSTSSLTVVLVSGYLAAILYAYPVFRKCYS